MQLQMACGSVLEHVLLVNRCLYDRVHGHQGKHVSMLCCAGKRARDGDSDTDAGPDHRKRHKAGEAMVLVQADHQLQMVAASIKVTCGAACCTGQRRLPAKAIDISMANSS